MTNQKLMKGLNNIFAEAVGDMNRDLQQDKLYREEAKNGLRDWVLVKGRYGDVSLYAEGEHWIKSIDYNGERTVFVPKMFAKKLLRLQEKCRKANIEFSDYKKEIFLKGVKR